MSTPQPIQMLVMAVTAVSIISVFASTTFVAGTDITIQNDTGYTMQLTCDDIEEAITLQNQAAVFLLDPPSKPQNCVAAWNGRSVSFVADNTIAAGEANWDFIGNSVYLNSKLLTASQANKWNISGPA